MEEEKFEEIKKFKDDVFSKLEIVISKEKNLKEREDNLNKISMDRRAQRNEGDIVGANRIHLEEYMPLYEANEKLKKEILEDNAAIDEIIAKQEDILKEKENEFNRLSMERRNLRDEDNIFEANELHKEKINPLYEEIESFRKAISEMKELQEKNKNSKFEQIAETITKYNDERREKEKEAEEKEAIDNFEKSVKEENFEENNNTGNTKMSNEESNTAPSDLEAKTSDEKVEGEVVNPRLKSKLFSKNIDENEIIEGEPKYSENRSIDNSTNTTQSNKSALDGKKYKITIGSDGKIKRNGSTYTIAPIYFKEGASLNESYKNMPFDKFKDLVKDKYPQNIVDMIEEGHKNSVPIDFTILNTINNVSSIPKLERQELIKGYLSNVLGAFSANLKVKEPNLITADSLEKYENTKKLDNMEIVYDLKDLSKPVPFLKTLLSFNPEVEQLTIKEKEGIAQLADKAKDYKIGEKKGEFKYKISIFTKILSLFKKNRNLLPAPEEVKHYDDEKMSNNNGETKDEVIEEPQKENIRNRLRVENKEQEEEGKTPEPTDLGQETEQATDEDELEI